MIMTVMIVDDNSRIRSMIRKIIQSIAETIYECPDGIDAVQMYSRVHPDVVLMDIKMPKMDGITAVEKIMQMHPQANVIIVSNYNDEGFIEKAKRIGVKQYVLKENIYQLPIYLQQYN